jgi:hypothetical protein
MMKVSLLPMRLDPRRLRPAELLALTAGLLLAVSLFLPWFDFSSGRENAWNAATITAIIAIAAALAALVLVAVTLTQRSPTFPVALAVVTTVLGFVAVVVVGLRTLALPDMALGRCYGLWLGLAGSLAVLAAGWFSMRDERPFWGVSASGLSQP